MADFHQTAPEALSEQEYELMEERMRLFIFPNEPETEEQTQAFSRAVTRQIEHERSRAAEREGLPESVTAFKVGDFSMSFAAGETSAALTRKNICPAAYWALLKAGLLYRGLEGR